MTETTNVATSNWAAIADANEEAYTTAAESAAARVSFALAYARTGPREFSAQEMDGPMVPNAYGDGEQWILWVDGDDPDEISEDGFVDKFARMAISEAVHEALEWFRVDGEPWLDPHSMVAEAEVLELSRRFAADLAALRKRSLSAVLPSGGTAS